MPNDAIDRRSLLCGRLAGGDTENAHSDGGDQTRHMLQIKAERCVGCDVCAQVCAPGALQIVHHLRRAYYAFDPIHCDGCGICLELCEVDAIELKVGVPATARQYLALDEARCRTCGIVFHVPQSAGAALQTCRICAARSLHQ